MRARIVPGRCLGAVEGGTGLRQIVFLQVDVGKVKLNLDIPRVTRRKLLIQLQSLVQLSGIEQIVGQLGRDSFVFRARFQSAPQCIGGVLVVLEVFVSLSQRIERTRTRVLVHRRFQFL